MSFLSRISSRKLISIFALSALPLLSNAQPAQAAMPQLNELQQQMLNELKKSQQELQQTQMAVRELEQKILQNSPNLQKQREAIGNKLREKMNSNGFDAMAEAKALEDIKQKYRASGEKPSQAVIADFQKRQQALKTKQMQVMQDPEVKKMTTKFNDDLMAEAKKVDPNAPALIARMQSQVAKMQSLQQKLQQSMVQQAK